MAAFMNVLTLLLPDFLLILLGYVLIRITDWGNNFWAGLEKLVYFVLFPALLLCLRRALHSTFMPQASYYKLH